MMNPTLPLVNDLLPPELRDVFNFPSLNAMQQTLFQQSFHSDMNMVVAAPTGSGKTVIMELAILRLYIQKSQSLRTMKVVYIAPNKALCQQRWSEWNKKFHQRLQLNILEVTGDVEIKDSLRTIAKAHVIVTTPEKWDSLTRMWRDHVFLMGAIDLLLIDEIHHLGEDRGPVLEMVIVRMRMISEICREKAMHSGALENMTHDNANRKRLRIVGLSATLPNLGDIGEWLGCTQAGIHYFDDSFRPIPLQAITLVCGNMGNPFLFDRSLDNRVKDVIMKYCEGKQTLIFCSSKNNAQNLTIKLRDQSTIRLSTMNTTIPTYPQINQPDVIRVVNSLQDETLKALVFQGYGYHHAGLPPDDRNILEELYLKGYIRILCSTSTLAHGVNLPAHLVIIKGTYCWRGSSKGYEKLGRSDVIQMLGRAGRPGFDSHGIAVIMTSNEDRAYYSNLSLSADVVDSKLTTILPEAMVAEISQTVIKSVADAKNWIMSTFFFIRSKNHMLSRLKQGDEIPNIDKGMENTCLWVMKQLHDANIIEYDALTGQVSPKPEAFIMSKHLTKFSSMKILLQISGIVDLPKVLRTICQCQELDKPVRRGEKKLLNEWMSHDIRYPIKERVQQPLHKAYVLLQVAIARLPMKDFTLKIEQAEMVDNCMRLLRCLRDLSIERRQGYVLECAILLDRALRSRLWEYGTIGGSSNIFTQCAGITDRTIKALHEAGYTTPGHLQGINFNHLMNELSCTLQEARALLYFSQELLQSSLMAVCSITTHCGTRQLTVTIYPTESHGNDSIDADYTTTSTITYQLICIDAKTGMLLLHRLLSPNSTTCNSTDNGDIQQYGRKWEYSVNLPTPTIVIDADDDTNMPTTSSIGKGLKRKSDHISEENKQTQSKSIVEEQVKVCLYADIVGLDFVKEAILLADPMVTKNKVTIRNIPTTTTTVLDSTTSSGNMTTGSIATAARTIQPSEFGISSTPRNPFEAFKLDNPPISAVTVSAEASRNPTTGGRSMPTMMSNQQTAVSMVTPNHTPPKTKAKTNKATSTSAANASTKNNNNKGNRKKKASTGNDNSSNIMPFMTTTSSIAAPSTVPATDASISSQSSILLRNQLKKDPELIALRAVNRLPQGSNVSPSQYQVKPTTSPSVTSVVSPPAHLPSKQRATSKSTLSYKASKEVCRDTFSVPHNTVPTVTGTMFPRGVMTSAHPFGQSMFFDDDWQHSDGNGMNEEDSDVNEGNESTFVAEVEDVPTVVNIVTKGRDDRDEVCTVSSLSSDDTLQRSTNQIAPTTGLKGPTTVSSTFLKETVLSPLPSHKVNKHNTSHDKDIQSVDKPTLKVRETKGKVDQGNDQEKTTWSNADFAAAFLF